MAIVFSGNLAYLQAIHILKLLVSDNRSGKLILQNEDNRENGEIYLNGGRIVHAVCENYLGEPAFNELVHWRSGKFAFEPDTASFQETIGKETAQLLSESEMQVQAWQKISRHIPSFNVKFKGTGHTPHASVKLKAKDWDVLHALGEDEASVTELAAKLNQHEMDVAVILYNLVEADVIQAGVSAQPVPREVVDAKIFKAVENELIQLIGPVASIIIDDVIESFGESRSNFPKDKVPALVQGITNEIYDPQKQVTFQQFMLRQIKSL
jgi:hypothetical protein